MTDKTSHSANAFDLPATDQLLDGILEKAVNAAQRNVEQFMKLAELARALEQSNSSPADRAKLLFRFEEIASDGEVNAQLDVELFQGLRDGQLMKQEMRRAHEDRADSIPEGVIVAPSNTTKH